MTELSLHDAAFAEQLAGDMTTRLTATNQHALEFISRTQRTLFEEMMLTGNETFDRMRIELGLFAEFASKIAEAHSVDNLQTMWEQCSRHQIDFLRRDFERLFRHGERLIEATAKLAASRQD
jgi:hypothetical protein